MKLSRRVLGLLCVACGSVVTVASYGHHAQAPFFDQERTVEVRGVVVRWIFRNPHPVLEVEAPNDEGETVVWAVQFAPATVLSKRGWTDRTFKAGDTVVATGHPSRAPGTYGLEQRSLARADGSPIVPD